jgi:hypothetical protein
MDAAELLNLYRQEMRDTETPYLIGDEEVYSYLDDAQKMFCRLTEGIEDSRTPDICRISVVAGQEWYPTSKLIRKIRGIYRTDTGREVPLVNSEMAYKQDIRFDGRVGPVRCLVTGLDKNALRAWPVPSEDATLEMRVFRLPLRRICDCGNQALEIDEQHHRHLLLWVKHLAYDNHDTEMFSKRKSDEYKAKFDAYCFQAMKEQERSRRSVGVTIYGGI